MHARHSRSRKEGRVGRIVRFAPQRRQTENDASSQEEEKGRLPGSFTSSRRMIAASTRPIAGCHHLQPRKGAELEKTLDTYAAQ